MGWGISNLGECYMMQDKLDQAKDCYYEALRISQSLSADEQLAQYAHILLGRLYQARKQPELAKQHYRQGLKIAKERGDLRHYAEGSIWLCSLHYEQGTFDEAAPYILETEEIIAQQNLVKWAAALRTIQAASLFDKGRYEEGFTKYMEAMTYALRYNRYLLDETAEKIMEKTKQIAGKGQEGAARALIERLIEYWQMGALDGKPLVEVERERREREKGDGKPQTMVVEQLEAWLRALDRESNANNRR